MTGEKEHGFCYQCFQKNEASEEVRTRGIAIADCTICKANDTRFLPSSDRQLKRVFRALVRLHYSEWDYNTHLGGHALESLMFEANPIFRAEAVAHAEEFEEAYLPLEDGWYPESEEDITLGGGYWDGGILWSVGGRLDASVSSIMDRAFNEHGSMLEAEVLRLLTSIQTDVSTEIPAGTIYFRARIGTERRYTKELPDVRPEYSYAAFCGEKLDAPPLKLASEGRLNRFRDRVLYLSEDARTAVAEVRPHPGHLVSTAQFRLKDALKVADFRHPDIRRFLSDSRLEQLRTIVSINQLLNLPIQPDTHELYAVTQLLADGLRRSGYGGVQFESAIGSGFNVASFDPGRFEQVADTEQVFEVEALEYRLKERQTVRPSSDLKDLKESGSDPLSTLYERISRLGTH